jgi:SAM-dependent methyltransferase
VDFSSAMLEHAARKAVDAGVGDRTDFHIGDVRQVLPGAGRFDAAIMMFAVLGYQKTDNDVLSALSAARSYLVPGAPFIFDIWYGPGVIADKPGPRERVIENGAERIIRRTNAILDEAQHLCTVQFDLETWRDGERITETHEEHGMRFFFQDELVDFARQCDFDLVTLRDFPDWNAPVRTSSWNSIGMLRAI